MKSALAAFQTLPLKDAARQLLAQLGYQSDKFLVGAGSKPQDFLADFASGHPFDQTKALVPDWKSADLLFQLTDQELSRESSLFTDDSVQRGLLKSYIFIAIELKGSDYARGKFSGIARQINRLFPMPVMVIFKHGDRLTIAVINRRRNKLDDNKDVLEKATLIRDITFAQPHRGHLDILESLALTELKHPQKLPITDFDTLHSAWEQIFNVELLNERFYRELANWYFWALPQVEFPADLEPDDEKRRATGLIRLLTRLIFCWFLKEKSLIPEKLFHPTDLAQILKGGPDNPVWDPESKSSSTYYLAVLQNLFFATLNQRMGKDAKGQSYRVFAKDEGFQKNRATYDVNNLYRYEALFRDEPDAALAHFADIPFLNGGLFECLDRTEESVTDIPVCAPSEKTDKSVRSTFKKRYLDGFSRNAKKRPHVPDRLFFGGEETVNLADTYGDTKRRAERVSGLIRILNRYKFTIVENTPIDQEIALDPELLGKVFENLLASYNEETKTTARKQTGSFYTPRPIVDYMVDESLKAHLEQKVAQTILSGSSANQPQTGLSGLPSEISKAHRNLPHWTKDNATYWITFRLADSLPQEKLNAWKAERDAWVKIHPEPWNDKQWNEYDERFGQRLEDWLDAGAGECPFRRPEICTIVAKCLLHFDGDRYDLIDWVIMPNHVHLLIRPKDGQSLSKILQGIKGVSAKDCNALLGKMGQTFWQEESYDHIVRSQAQLDHFVRYIAENPVKAKLKEGEFQSSRGNPAPESNQTQTGLSGLRSKLDLLFAYTEKAHAFTPAEVACLIAAIDALKILDPACGSGAFPMGVLHKLVYILGKLDPGNDRWKATQLAKLDSAPMREELERAFADNNDDYGRKLYLIENCLYGVDIQPIAIQITKLRFFISLVCDQKTNRNKKDNHGIRPLPNLETKFVAADTLIGLPEMTQSLLVDPRVGVIEKEIESLYHSHFSIQRRDQKLALQRKIKTLRQELAKLLAESLMSPAKSKHVAEWDPFDPQSSADFFDPHWMFGRSLANGFDVVIGNPPWGATLTKTQKERLKADYPEIDSSTPNSFAYFLGAALRQSHLSIAFVLPDSILIKDYARTRELVAPKITDIAWYLNTGVPESCRQFVYVEHDVCVLILNQAKSSASCHIRKQFYDPAEKENRAESYDELKKNFIFKEHDFCFNLLIRAKERSILEKLEGHVSLGSITQCHEGIHTGNSRDLLFHDGAINKYCKPLFYGGRAGDRIANYYSERSNWYVDYRASIIDKEQGFYASLRDERIFTLPKIYITRTGNPIMAFYDADTYASNNFFSLQLRDYAKNSEENLKAILPLILSSLANYYIRTFAAPRLGDTYIETKIIHLNRIPVSAELLRQSGLFLPLTNLMIAAVKGTLQTQQGFLSDLIDACVMECYFREHMAERDLLFHDTVAPHLAAYAPEASAAQQRDYLTHLHQTLNAPSHPIRNRLLRLTADSPDLLAIIKAEGKV